MPKKVPSPELRTGLSQARKKPRNYVLIAKGTSAVKLIVQKLMIKAGEILEAKTAAKGTLVVEGVCFGNGAEMIFQVLGEEPSVKTISIKELIDEQTELKLKPRFEVVKQLIEVDQNDGDTDEDESDEDDAEQPVTSNTSTTEPPPPPPPAPPPPPNATEAAIAQLIAAKNKLEPIIQTALKSNSQRLEELQQGLTAFQSQVQISDVTAAKNTLIAVGKLAKELAAPPAQQASPVTNPIVETKSDDPKAAAWNKAWGAIEAEYQSGLKTAADDLASKLRVVHAYAFEQAEAGQYDKALTALSRLRPLLDQAALGRGASEEVAAGTVEKRKFLLERFKLLPAEVRPSVDKLNSAITEQVPDEDAQELCDIIQEALNDLFDELRDEIDEAITAGDMSQIAGVKSRVTGHELIQHLFKNPLIDGSPFQQLLLAAIDEVETKLAT